ncbi:FAD/NAD(P)-binding domain-containing protein [Agrocybe pediades]|nr:FAD/NAD(P)-binding domain-containing protein [Agrocybe pediades]
MTSPQKIRVAIIGSGIGGLTLAVGLSKLEVDDFLEIQVYESTSQLTQLGAGIMMWPRGWEIMQSLGLQDSLARKMSSDQELPSSEQLKPTFNIKRGDMKNGTHIVNVMMPGGSVSFHRADVQEVLLEHVSPSIKMHLSHRLINFHETADGTVELEFKNGHKAACDLLIAADGINSVIRKIILARKNNWTEEEAARFAQPLWTGSICYRNTIAADTIRSVAPNHRALTSPMMYIGKNRHLIAYPIMKGTLINTVPFISNYEKEGTYVEGPVMLDSSSDNLKDQFLGWDDEVEILLKHMSNPTRWTIQTVSPMSSYISGSGRVILLGDAAHGAPPHLGNGAGQAIEDVYILSHILAKGLRSGKLADISKAAKVYDEIRQPFGNFAAAATNKLGHLLDLDAPGFETIKDGEEVPKDAITQLGDSIQDLWSWTWKSAKPDLERALAML